MARTSTLLCLLWLFASSALAVRAVLGIDFGTEYIKASLVKPGIPLEIVLTKDSRRKETSAVAFKPVRDAKAGEFPERLYGSDAMSLAARFPGNVYPNLKSVLGQLAQSSAVQEYSSRYPALKIDVLPARDTVSFKSTAFGSDEEPFTVEEIVAMELQSIKKNAESMAGKGSSIKDVVITVPPFFTAEERRSIELAADLAGLNLLAMTSDGLAVGLNYATSRTFADVSKGGKPEVHLIFDMGAGSTKATVVKFQGRTVKDVGKFNKTIQEVQVVGASWDRTLGGDALNRVIVDDMIKAFVVSKAAKAASVRAESVSAHGRAMAKLWKEAERIRQVLSANADAQSGFEGLFEDIDFRYKLSRAHFEELAQEHAARVAPVIEEALQKADIDRVQLDSVILHGGAVRTPFVQKQLEAIFGSADKIRSNVNADESAVFGAGFKGAELSPSFRVKEIKTFDVAGYPVAMKWTNPNGKSQQQKLFTAESAMGKVKTVSFQNQKDFELIFLQNVDTVDKEILRVALNNLTATVADARDKQGCVEADIVTKLNIRLNPENGEVEVSKALIHCEVDEEKKDSVVDSVKGFLGFGSKKGEQEPIVDDAEKVDAVGSDTATSATTQTAESASTAGSAAAQESKKPTKRTVEIPLSLTTERLGHKQLEPKDITRMKERLKAFAESDKARRLRDQALNELEGFTYRARDMIDDESFIAASTEVERASLVEKATAASEWLYGDGADATREELKARLKEMRDIVEPIQRRKEEAAQRPEKIKTMKDALDQTSAFINSIKEQIELAKAEAASSSASTASASTKPAESSSSTSPDDFAGLEDDETTSSSTSATPSPTPDLGPAPPSYTDSDLTEVTTLYTSVQEWFTAKQAAQDALPLSADPVLLVDELATKSQELTSLTMKIIMRAMKIPDPARPKKASSSTKSRKARATKAKTAKGPKTTEIEIEDGPKKGGPKVVRMDFGDDEMPTEEEILRKMKEQGVDFEDLRDREKKREKDEL